MHRRPILSFIKHAFMVLCALSLIACDRPKDSERPTVIIEPNRHEDPGVPFMMSVRGGLLGIDGAPVINPDGSWWGTSTRYTDAKGDFVLRYPFQIPTVASDFRMVISVKSGSRRSICIKNFEAYTWEVAGKYVKLEKADHQMVITMDPGTEVKMSLK